VGKIGPLWPFDVDALIADKSYASRVFRLAISQTQNAKSSVFTKLAKAPFRVAL
jgi:hypothetical protein